MDSQKYEQGKPVPVPVKVQLRSHVRTSEGRGLGQIDHSRVCVHRNPKVAASYKDARMVLVRTQRFQLRVRLVQHGVTVGSGSRSTRDRYRTGSKPLEILRFDWTDVMVLRGNVNEKDESVKGVSDIYGWRADKFSRRSPQRS